jgi:Putative oxalocrotonate tautomerase enzyme
MVTDTTIFQALKPWIEDRKELQWEIHISETPRDLWRIQGIDPPPTGSEEEKVWAKSNKAREYHL